MRSQIEAKNHAHREVSTQNELRIILRCPYHEAIIDENRLETALRNATGVPDLSVLTVEFKVNGQ